MNARLDPRALNPLPDLSEFRTKEMTLNYSYCASYGQWEIQVDVQNQLGFARHAHRSQGGWLHFKNGRLIRIEGMTSLPGEVKLGLRKAGFEVPE